MLILKELTRDFIPKGFDYVYDKPKELYKQLPWLYPKLDKTPWKLALINFDITLIRELIKEGTPDNVNIEIVIKKDVLHKLRLEYPKLYGKTNPYEEYMKTIGSLSKLITPKASRELYNRCRGNLNLAKQILKKLDEDVSITLIEISHINMKIIVTDTVYARDVILSLLLKDNKLVPKKGSYLSKYTYGNSKPYKLYEKLSYTIGEKVAFYACRKYVTKLLNTKIEYLNSKDVKEINLIRVLDFYKLVHAYTIFMKSIPEQAIACLHLIERRDECANIFSETILTYDN